VLLNLDYICAVFWRSLLFLLSFFLYAIVLQAKKPKGLYEIAKPKKTMVTYTRKREALDLIVITLFTNVPVNNKYTTSVQKHWLHIYNQDWATRTPIKKIKILVNITICIRCGVQPIDRRIVLFLSRWFWINISKIMKTFVDRWKKERKKANKGSLLHWCTGH
jgi:hypothetical protein